MTKGQPQESPTKKALHVVTPTHPLHCSIRSPLVNTACHWIRDMTADTYPTPAQAVRPSLLNPWVDPLMTPATRPTEFCRRTSIHSTPGSTINSCSDRGALSFARTSLQNQHPFNLSSSACLHEIENTRTQVNLRPSVLPSPSFSPSHHHTYANPRPQ